MTQANRDGADGEDIAAVGRMLRMAVRWREQAFDCELQSDEGVKWLHVYDGPELVWRESVVSLAAAYMRAREVAGKLSGRIARRA